MRPVLGQPFTPSTAGGWGSRGWLCFWMHGPQLSESLLHHRSQRLGLKSAGAQIGRNGEASLGGSAVQLSAFRLAHANGDAGVFQVSVRRGKDTRWGLSSREGACGNRILCRFFLSGLRLLVRQRRTNPGAFLIHCLCDNRKARLWRPVAGVGAESALIAECCHIVG